MTPPCLPRRVAPGGPGALSLTNEPDPIRAPRPHPRPGDARRPDRASGFFDLVMFTAFFRSLFSHKTK